MCFRSKVACLTILVSIFLDDITSNRHTLLPGFVSQEINLMPKVEPVSNSEMKSSSLGLLKIPEQKRVLVIEMASSSSSLKKQKLPSVSDISQSFC